jgi:glycosyltransferase involved in cell wall biosynthesis
MRPNRRDKRQAAQERTALFIAYHYPPIHSAGVERTLKFLRYLPEFGYRARVLTTSTFGGGQEPLVTRAWEPLALYRDWRNPAAASSVRTDPGVLKGVIRGMRRWLLVPDGQITWAPAALIRGLKLLRNYPADLLYSSYPPASAHMVALGLKRWTGLPWVADFRDAWTFDPLDPGLSQMPYRRALEKRLEEKVLRAADAIVVATQISAEYYCKAYPEAAARVQVITNGFDPEDLSDQRPVPLSMQTLCLVHTGSFAYSHPQRSPLALFGALESLLDADAAWGKKIRLVLAGRLTQDEEAAASRLEEAGMVEIMGSLYRPKALALQHRAHALVLVDHARVGQASNVPGKLYEYLAVRRPIVALCGPGMVARLVRQLDAGFVTPPDDPVAIRGLLEDLYERFKQGRLESGVDDKALKPFERRELTGQLAGCFDRVVEQTGRYVV